MFVTEMEGEDYIYAHCYEDDDEGNEYGCGMEYEYHPNGGIPDDMASFYEGGVLRHWHDAVGLVTTTRMTEDEWNELVAWHDAHCGAPRTED